MFFIIDSRLNAYSGQVGIVITEDMDIKNIKEMLQHVLNSL